MADGIVDDGSSVYVARCQLWIGEAGDGVIGDALSDLLRRLWSFGAEPVRRPVQRAEEGACGDRRVGRAQRAGADSGGNEGADAPLVGVALGDDARAQARRERVHLHVRRGSLDLVDKAQDVGGRDVAQAVRQRPAVLARCRQRLDQPADRAVLAEEEELLLAAEVVIEVAGRQIGGDRDLAHAGGRKAAGSEHARRRPHDRDPPGVGTH